MLIARRSVLALALPLAFACAPACAADKVNVGVLRFVSSAGMFLAQERGYFNDEGIDVNIAFVEAAQPIAVAVASGDVDFGATAITGGSLNLAAKGALKIIGSQGAERKGYKGNEIVVSNAAWAKGVTSLDKLANTNVAITQVGSSQHYMMGQIVNIKKIDPATVVYKPLQDVPNMISAVRSGQVDLAFLTPIAAKPLIEKGELKHLAWFSDVANYQYGALFGAIKVVTTNADLTRRFVRAYAKGNSDYAKAFLRVDAKGDLVVDDETKKAALQIAKYVAPSTEPEKAAPNVIAGAVFIDSSASLDVSEIDQQIAWYKKEKMVADNLDSKAFVDTSFLK